MGRMTHPGQRLVQAPHAPNVEAVADAFQRARASYPLTKTYMKKKAKSRFAVGRVSQEIKDPASGFGASVGVAAARICFVQFARMQGGAIQIAPFGLWPLVKRDRDSTSPPSLPIPPPPYEVPGVGLLGALVGGTAWEVEQTPLY